jgi:hypothetical protein
MLGEFRKAEVAQGVRCSEPPSFLPDPDIECEMLRACPEERQVEGFAEGVEEAHRLGGGDEVFADRPPPR